MVVEIEVLAIEGVDVAKGVGVLDKAGLLLQFPGGTVLPFFSGLEPAAGEAEESAVLTLAKEDFVLGRVGEEDAHAYAGNFDFRLRECPC